MIGNKEGDYSSSEEGGIWRQYLCAAEVSEEEEERRSSSAGEMSENEEEERKQLTVWRVETPLNVPCERAISVSDGRSTYDCIVELSLSRVR